MIEVGHPVKSIPPLYPTIQIDRVIRTLQQAILQPLVITLFVIMRHVVRVSALSSDDLRLLAEHVTDEFAWYVYSPNGFGLTEGGRRFSAQLAVDIYL